MNIGENIKKAREYKKISQDKLAKLSNIPRTSLGRYERCERTPNVDILNKIANALGVIVQELITG
jgi:transcriptional regulator with XRE-family HTH domain